MRIILAMFLSCFAVPAAYADVIVMKGGTVVTGERFEDGREVRVYNPDASYYPNSAFIIKDGKFEQMQDGTYDVNGQKININNGRMNATFGNQDIESRVKINP